MNIGWRFNPKKFLQVCSILMAVDDDDPEFLYRSVINRSYLVSLQVAAYHIKSRGMNLPDTSEYYKLVREKLLEIGADENIKDDLDDLQDMRVKSDYRYMSTICEGDATHCLTTTDRIIHSLDSQFPNSCL